MGTVFRKTFTKPLPAGGRFEVDAHALLPGVEHQKWGGFRAGRTVPGRLAKRWLDFDDVGAEVRQEQRAVRDVVDLAELQDDDAFQCSPRHAS